MKYISTKEYENCFSRNNENENPQTKKEEALARAWKNRDFEIEMYWKRATYFWVFLVTTFTGYFALQAVNITKENQINIYFLNLIIICLGICFSLSWILVNKGSKKWQENWEAHIDMLENEITGPIYKMVLDKERYNYSVSKINLDVSRFVLFIWVVILLYFIYKCKCYFCLCCTACPYFTLILYLTLIGLGIFVWKLLHKNKTNEKKKRFYFYLRESKISD